jgi:hypothetical protein
MLHKTFDLSFGRPQADIRSTYAELGNKLKIVLLNNNAKLAAAEEQMIPNGGSINVTTLLKKCKSSIGKVIMFLEYVLASCRAYPFRTYR